MIDMKFQLRKDMSFNRSTVYM